MYGLAGSLNKIEMSLLLCTRFQLKDLIWELKNLAMLNAGVTRF